LGDRSFVTGSYTDDNQQEGKAGGLTTAGRKVCKGYFDDEMKDYYIQEPTQDLPDSAGEGEGSPHFVKRRRVLFSRLSKVADDGPEE